MYEINEETELTLVEKKSKFITRLKVISSEQQAKEILQSIKAAEKGASHNCYAWRLLKENGQVYIKRGDDGEPSGTAGAPMLAVLTGENLVNVLAVTTRYFGGIKLGTGGLAQMYKRGVCEAIAQAGKELYVKKYSLTITAPINKGDMLLSLLDKAHFPIETKEFSSDISICLETPEERVEELKGIVKRVRGILSGIDA